MSSDFEHTLKMLGKQARQAEKARIEAEAAQRRREAEIVDFAAAVGEVVPLKNTQRYAPPRDASPIKPRAKNEAARAEEDYFYVGTGGFDEPPATFSKNGQGQNDIRRLQSGHWPVVADVDLHGYTQEEAQQVLNELSISPPGAVCAAKSCMAAAWALRAISRCSKRWCAAG